MQNSLLDLGSTLSEGQTSYDLDIDKPWVKVKYKKEPIKDLVANPVTSSGISVELPASLGSTSGSSSSNMIFKASIFISDRGSKRRN